MNAEAVEKLRALSEQMSNVSAAEWIAFIADFVTIVGVPFAAVTALVVWRRQVRKQAEHTAAIAALAGAKRLVNAIRAYRSPIRWVDLDGPGALTGTAESEREILNRRRELYVEPAVQDLTRAEVVASLLWSRDFDLSFKPIRDCVFDLNHYTDSYLRRLAGTPGLRSSGHLFEEAKSYVISSGSDENPDEFTKRVSGAFAQLEAVLRPKLAVPTRKQREEKSTRKPR